MGTRNGPTLAHRFIFPGVLAAVARKPDYRDVFPIGAGLSDWVTWSA